MSEITTIGLDLAKIFGPAIIDRHVLAVDIADLLQPTVKSAQTVCQRVRRLAVEESDDRYPRLLLRARHERPSSNRPPRSVMNSRRFIIR
jgi:hypothetical protein